MKLRVVRSFSCKLPAFTLLLLSLTCQARIGVEYQMTLGNPSGARADTNNHEHYLVQRAVFAMDYDDREGEPNWVSWDLTAADMGPAKRTPSFHPDAQLPANFRHVTSGDYKRSGFDRGHMCPSADRTDNATDNEMVFTMANIVPQTPDNNQGVWEHLEAECRKLAQAGNELLITCGPAGFSGKHLSGNDPVLVPSYNWKIVVVVPDGPGSALRRITAETRVIAVDIPNQPGVRNEPWTKYLVSVNQLEILTGLKFFTALAPEVAAGLKAKVDGQPQAAVSAVVRADPQTHSVAVEMEMNWLPVALVLAGGLLVFCIVVLMVFWRTKPKK